ncbi:hypothetical protein HA402_000447 [Bradysia odoriphaga]|nr:hypothetical protein HA402_000447 [Bradysia odoriphaga]
MKAVLALLLIQIACVLSTPVDQGSIDPLFDAYRDTRILLITRQNLNNPIQVLFRNADSIRNSPYNPNRPTRVLIHGFLEDDSADIKVETAAELLRYYDFNVFFIDWSEGSRTINYFAAAGRVPTVGQFTASYLDFLHEIQFLDFSRLSVIGFSLGAHIAGHVGKNARRGRIQHIIGLDPAGPLFSVRSPEGRIDASDGVYVECIHTNGPTLAIIGLGIGAAICDADYFPNGGQSQPGCLLNTCSHSRAVDFYVESIANNRFHALGCPDPNDISSRRCLIYPGEWMGGDNLNFNKSGRGSFYLETNRSSPFARGTTRPQ